MSITKRLKAETWDLHSMAEHRPLQQRLARGEVTHQQYAAWLGQLLLVHRALERCLDDVAGRHAGFEAVVREYHRHEPQLRADLEFLGLAEAGAGPLPATAALVETIERAAADEPVALLGMLYVLEGSTNGAKFLARALGNAFGLDPGRPGLSYFDPHGPQQRSRWAQFKADMDTVAFTARERDLLIDAARTVFQGIAEMSDELNERETVAV